MFSEYHFKDDEFLLAMKDGHLHLTSYEDRQMRILVTLLYYFGGKIQLSNSIKLLSENWIIPDLPVIVSFGTRFFNDNLAADFGFLRPVGENTDMEG
ncbi:MAG: hypothetical protein F9K42_09845 [Ignavibacterium sp.]|nr:MAG: hypothetical protein F9K42_09845 [Ignavibacterium sp.]